MYFKYHVESILNSTYDLVELLYDSSLLMGSLIHDLRNRDKRYKEYSDDILEFALLNLPSDNFKFTYDKENWESKFKDIQGWLTGYIKREDALETLCVYANDVVLLFGIRVELAGDLTRFDSILSNRTRYLKRVECLRLGVISNLNLVLPKTHVDFMENEGIYLEVVRFEGDVVLYFSNNPKETVRYHIGDGFEPSRVDEIVNELVSLSFKSFKLHYAKLSEGLSVEHFKKHLPDNYSKNYHQVVTTAITKVSKEDPYTLEVKLEVFNEVIETRATFKGVRFDSDLLEGGVFSLVSIRINGELRVVDTSFENLSFLELLAFEIYKSTRAESIVNSQVNLSERNSKEVKTDPVETDKLSRKRRSDKRFSLSRIFIRGKGS